MNKSDLKQNVELRLNYCGSEDCKPGHSWGPGVKDCYKLLYINKGKGEFTLNGKTYELTKGQAFLMFPYVVCSYKADYKEPWSYSWVACSGLKADLYLGENNLFLEKPVLNFSDSSFIESNIQRVIEASKSSNNRDLKLMKLLYEFLLIITDEFGISEPVCRQQSLKEIYISKAIEFIQLNYSTPISITEISSYIGIGRKYLSKIFKEQLSMAPQIFLTDLRMKKSCELLENTLLSVGEIAHSVGYADQFQFSRMFKKVKKISPSEYRKHI